jgi:uncharacterized protein
MSPQHRWLLKWARTVHLYAALFALTLVLFFALTGFMLNHEDWFSPRDPFTRTWTGSISTGLLQEPDKLGVVEILRKDMGASGVVDSVEVEEDRLRVLFKRPGTNLEAVVQRNSGDVELTSETRGIVGLVLDLHRGKVTGTAWSLILDSVCAALVLISGTGLVLWWSLRGRGRHTILLLVLGLVLGLFVYFQFVP